MIARIHFNLLGERLQATLDDDGTWSCADPDVRRFLKFWLPPESAREYVRKVAKALDGRAEFATPDAAKINNPGDAAK